MSNIEFTGYIDLYCNLERISKHVVGIGDILINGLDDTQIEKTNSSAPIRISYFCPTLSFTADDATLLKSNFLLILEKPELLRFGLMRDTDNLMLLSLHLYDKLWDTEGYSFNTTGSAKSFKDLNDDEQPQNYRDVVRAKELAKFLKIHHHHELYPDETVDTRITLTLKLGSQEAVIKDQTLLDTFLAPLIRSFSVADHSLGKMIENFGEIGALFLIKYQKNLKKKQFNEIKKRIEHIENLQAINPYSLKNKAICQFCLTLKHYLNQERFFKSKPYLPNPMIILFSEILNLFKMDFGSFPHDSPEYRRDLAKAIRDYQKV